jgi:broad specificity phosphatase PhoE
LNGPWWAPHHVPGEKPCDSPLSEDGLQQARELGQRLADVDLDFIFSSPFLRCVQTADAVAAAQQQRRRRATQQRQHQRDDDDDGETAVPIYIEHALGEWEDGKRISPRTTAELKSLFPRVDDEAYTSVVPPHPPGYDDGAGGDGARLGETVHELHRRCERFVEFVNGHEVFGAEGKRILFVGHAASTIAFYRAWVQDRTADFFPATCSLSKLVLLDGDDHDDGESKNDGDSNEDTSPSPASSLLSPQQRRSPTSRWRTELSGDCSHLSSGQQRPWRFAEHHDQELALATTANQ